MKHIISARNNQTDNRINQAVLSLSTALTLTLLFMPNAFSAIHEVPQDPCGQYAAKAVYQNRTQQALRCGFKGSRWNNDGAGQHKWCRTVRPAITEGETKARATQLVRCLNPRLFININDLGISTSTLNNEMTSSAYRGATARMQQLIAAGADFSSNKNKLMSYAISACKTETISFLRRAGVPLSEKGKNPLVQFAYRSDNEAKTFVSWLLKNGVNPNDVGHSGYTPLREAIYYQSEAMVALLLRHRANPNLDIKGGACKSIMPLDLAIDKGNNKIINLLRQKGAKSQAQCTR